MNKLNVVDVYFDGQLAGLLERKAGRFLYRYDYDYFNDDNGLPISASLPKQEGTFEFDHLPYFFEGLAPQGWYKNALLNVDKIDKKDSLTLLGINGLDLPGAVEMVAKDIEFQMMEELVVNSSPVIRQKHLGSCLICFKPLENKDYHPKCLKDFFGLSKEPGVPIDKTNFTNVIYKRLRRASMSGAQVKVGASINKDNCIIPQAVDSRYIIKPIMADCANSAVCEHLSMKITEHFMSRKDDVARSALIKLMDGDFAYITKRFDRQDKPLGKIHFEDLSQLLGLDQFEGSYEEVAKKISRLTNPFVATQFLKALLVQFYIGNNDFHLKNIALNDIKKDGTYEGLTPLYDCINAESLGFVPEEGEMAINFFEDDSHFTPIFLRDGHCSYQTFEELYRLVGANVKGLDGNLKKINNDHDKILAMVDRSFLDDEGKIKFKRVLNDRLRKLNKKA